VNRHALLSVGLLITGVAAAIPGCGEETSGGKGDTAGEAGAAGKDAGGEHAGGTGSVVKPSAGAGGEGGKVEAHGGAGGAPEGGTPSAGAGGVATGGAGGAGGEGVDFGDCLGSAAFGTLGLVDGLAGVFGEDAPGAAWQGTIRVEGTNYAELAVELYDGLVPFEAGVTTLTNHVLAGDDLNYVTCGLCLRVLERDALNDLTRVYMVTGGTVTLSSVSGRIAGSASNLTFEEVMVADNLFTTPVPGGCQSSIKSVSFDESTGEGGAGGGGGGGN
jgi:hypothetical protein